MRLHQTTFQLQPHKRGFHLITSTILRAIEGNNIKTGMCQIFIQHKSASLTINENADPTVRKDFEMFFNKTVKENDPDYFMIMKAPMVCPLI